MRTAKTAKTAPCRRRANLSIRVRKFVGSMGGRTDYRQCARGGSNPGLSPLGDMVEDLADRAGKRLRAERLGQEGRVRRGPAFVEEPLARIARDEEHPRFRMG